MPMVCGPVRPVAGSCEIEDHMLTRLILVDAINDIVVVVVTAITNWFEMSPVVITAAVGSFAASD